MLRALIKTSLAASVLTLALMTSAAAQVDPTPYYGAWWSAIDWDGVEHDGDGAKYDFHRDGTFFDHSNSETGTWFATSGGIVFTYDRGARSVFTGTLIGNVVLGTMSNGDIDGQFALARGAYPY